MIVEKPKKMKAMRIITTTLYLLSTIFFLYLYVSMLLDNGEAVGLAQAIMIIIVGVYGSIFYGVTLLVTAISLIVSAVKFSKKLVTKGTLIYFIVLSIVIIVTYLLFLFVAPHFIG